MYRAIVNLKTGKRDIKRGEAFARHELAAEVASKLLSTGRIVEVFAPPVSELPQFSKFLDQLADLDITMADQFVDLGPNYLASALRVSVEEVKLLQESVRRSLDAPRSCG